MAFLIGIRMIELVVSSQNEKWLRANGAVEYGQKHYPYIVLLHSGFILSLIVEYYLKPTQTLNSFFLMVYLVLIGAKVMVISSLGKYWNTKIFHISGHRLVSKGLYRYVKHPNYIIVICEIAVIPFIFNLYVTAAVFFVLNAIMLTIRIKEENKILKDF